MKRLLILAAIALCAGAAAAEDIITIPTRAGVTQSYLIAPASGKAGAVAVLFPGGAGKVNLEAESARATLDRGNFLVRSRRLFAAAGIVAVVMDAPSDQPSGMSDIFRLGGSHGEDIEKTVADLKKRYPGLPVFLVGTSRGTVSAAANGKRLGKEVDGVVLTSSLFQANRNQQGLSAFDFSTIPSPVLFVHHVKDECGVTPYSAAKRLSDRFPLISVSGGSQPQSEPCEAMSHHGYIGKEAETADAIAKWMLKQPYPREIN